MESIKHTTVTLPKFVRNDMVTHILEFYGAQATQSGWLTNAINEKIDREKKDRELLTAAKGELSKV